MRENNTKPASAALVKWPAIFFLSLAWGVGALLSLLFGGLGKVGHSMAEWSFKHISELLK